MRLSTLLRIAEDKIIAAAKATQPQAQHYVRSATDHATADGCIKLASKMEG